jgi:Fe-S cluster assembly ATP-binding protein
MLLLKNLTISVSHKKIIKDFSYHFEAGKTYVIMGPNGSGKSTLAFGIMGHPNYLISAGDIYFNKEKITTLTADKRAKRGLFMSFQSPLSLSGVTLFQLLKMALGKKIDPLSLKEDLEKKAKELDLKDDILNRSLNDSTSGGEKKKIEVIQAVILKPKFVILDEIDTGVDVDALKKIANFLEKNKKNKTYVIITHYQRILRYLKADRVLVINKGKLVKEGDAQLAVSIEKNGYTRL